MAVVEAQDLVREFYTHTRRPGLKGAIKSLFSRDRKAVRAVDGVSFSVERGEVVGYLGPNGAGKSTTIKILCGILVPTSGQVRVNGLIPHHQRRQNARRIGAVFGQRTQLWWDLPAIESLRILAALYDVPASTYRENLTLFDEVLGFGEFAAKAVRQLSLGQRMRADLAAALIHNPDVLYLDEPTVGMDVLVKEQVRQFVRRIARERGTTVLLTTHDLRDVEQLCHRVLIIDRGRIVYQGSLPDLKRAFGRERVLVVQPAEPGTPVELSGARVVGHEDGRVRLAFPADRNPQGLIAELATRYAIADLSLEEPDLEAVIREIYRRGSVA